MTASCEKQEKKKPSYLPKELGFIQAVDVSSYPEIAAANTLYYDSNSVAVDLLAQLKNNGVNTVRLRLWVNPASGHCGFDEVKRFSQQAKSLGFHIWLSVHYSDTWADPAHQIIPNAWQGLAFDGLKDSLRAYTRRVVKEMQPDIIQLGNEINGGLLLPAGDMNANKANCIALLQAGSEKMRPVKLCCMWQGWMWQIGFAGR
jgi:arabinogalactan endo-1,4-beta-galactosidase